MDTTDAEVTGEMDFLQGMKIEDIPLPPMPPPMRTEQVHPQPDTPLSEQPQQTMLPDPPQLNELNSYGGTNYVPPVLPATPEGKTSTGHRSPIVRISPEAGDEGAQEKMQLATGNLLQEQRKFPEPDTNEWVTNAFYIVNGAVRKAITAMQQMEETQVDDATPKKTRPTRGSGGFSAIDLNLLKTVYPGVDANIMDDPEETDDVFTTPSKDQEDDIVLDFRRIKSTSSSPESVEQSYYSLDANQSTRDEEQDFEDCTILEAKESQTDINANELVTDIDDYDGFQHSTPSAIAERKCTKSSTTVGTPYRIAKKIIDSESETETHGSFAENTPTNAAKERISWANESSASIEKLLSQVTLSETPNDSHNEGRSAGEYALEDSCLESPSKPPSGRLKLDMSGGSIEKSYSYSDTFIEGSGSSGSSKTSSITSEESSAASVQTDIEDEGADIEAEEDANESHDADHSLDFTQLLDTLGNEATAADVYVIVPDDDEKPSEEKDIKQDEAENTDPTIVSTDSVVSLTSTTVEPTPIGSLSQKMCAGKWDLTQISADSEDGFQLSKVKRDVFKRQSAISQQSSTDMDGSSKTTDPSTSTSESSGFQFKSVVFSTSAESDPQARSLDTDEEEALKLLNFDEYQSPDATPSASNSTVGEKEKEAAPLITKSKSSNSVKPTSQTPKLLSSSEGHFAAVYSVDQEDNIMEGEDLGNGNMIMKIDSFLASEVAPSFESTPEHAPQTFSIYDFDTPVDLKTGDLFEYSYTVPCGEDGFTNPLFDNVAAEVEIEAENVKYVKPKYQEGMLAFGNLAYEGEEEEGNKTEDHVASRAECASEDCTHFDRVVYDAAIQGDEPAPYDGRPDDSVEEYVDGIINSAVKELKEHPNSAGKRGQMKRRSTDPTAAECMPRSDRVSPGKFGGAGDGGRAGRDANGSEEPVKSICCCTII